jgi:N-methylhydantoinase B
MADPGGRSTKLMVRNDGSSENLPSKCDKIKVEPGDILYFNTWGGGGWGDPLKRDASKVAMDVRRGLVTRDGARRYGVVLREDHSVDAQATERLRDEMARSRGELPMFDRGGTIEELKARCRAETHLDPPSAPVFQKWMRRDRHVEAAE